jgi:hypothetical protein
MIFEMTQDYAVIVPLSLYYKQAVHGAVSGLTIQYSGPDEKLMMPRPRPNYSLTLSEVSPMLEELAYRK